MPKVVWINGVESPLEQATISVADHAHLYGDGLFEGIRFYAQKVYKLDEHLHRLYDGINFMGFEMPIGFEELKKIVLSTCQKSELQDGYIRLNVTRGTGLGLDPKNINRTANVMVMVSELSLYPPEKYEIGLSVMTSPYRVMPPDCLDPRVKCIGRYAANILAKQYANRVGAGDALMLNQSGQVAEGTGNNIFLVKNGVIHTPHPACGILRGITRDSVIALARTDGFTVIEDVLTPYDFLAADEAFFTGTATEVIAMVSLDGNKIGCGKPGRVTMRVTDLFRADVANGTPF